MSITTEVLRLQKSRDMLSAAETLKLSPVRKWRRLPLIAANLQSGDLETDGQVPYVENNGSGIYTITSPDGVGTRIGFYFDTSYPNDPGPGHNICVVVLPIGEEHLLRVDVDEPADGSENLYVLTEDLTTAGAISYDGYWGLHYTEGRLDILTDDSGKSTKVFVAVYETKGQEFSNDNWEYIDGTETLDELAISLYHYEEPSGVIDTSDATANPSDVALGASFYARRERLIGTIATIANRQELTLDEDGLRYNDGENSEYASGFTLAEGIYRNCTLVLAQNVKNKLKEYEDLPGLLSVI